MSDPKIILDHRLLELAVNGEVWAFDQLYNRYAGKLLNFINKMLNDTMIAEDILQDTFVKVFQNAKKYDPKYKFSTWIYRIAINLCINEINKSKLRKEKNEIIKRDIINEIYNPEKKVEITERRQRIISCLDKLSFNHRLVLILKFYQDLSYDEIASILNISKGTVKSRIHYAVEYLKSHFKESTDE